MCSYNLFLNMALKIVVNKLQDEALQSPVEITCSFQMAIKDGVLSVGIRQAKAGKETGENFAKLKRLGFKFENPTISLAKGNSKPLEVLNSFVHEKIKEEILLMGLTHVVSVDIV